MTELKNLIEIFKNRLRHAEECISDIQNKKFEIIHLEEIVIDDRLDRQIIDDKQINDRWGKKGPRDL